MSLAVVHSRAQEGVAAPPVTVEVHLSGGLPGTSIVGLPEAAVKEARDRVRVAILNARLDYPARRVTVNLAPADLPKDGGRFDLPIALGILAASGHLPREALAQREFLGELALSGELRAVSGVLPALLRARAAGRQAVVPQANAAEASLLAAADVRVAENLLDVCAHLRGLLELPRATEVVAAAEALVAGRRPGAANDGGLAAARRGRGCADGDGARGDRWNGEEDGCADGSRCDGRAGGASKSDESKGDESKGDGSGGSESVGLDRRGGAAAAGSKRSVCSMESVGSAVLAVDTSAGFVAATQSESPDLADVRGQAQARRALEIAAAGGHHLLFVGPPGTGKTLLASRLPGILPPLSDDEALESCAVRSVAGQGIDLAGWRRRPFRAPHHTASAAALVGGGSLPRPGEISLAHHGVLFLDELTEFDRHVLDVLREPLETGRILISRAARQAEFPAAFQLVAAMNPCPCGYAGDSSGRCTCTPDQVQRYRARVSGPLLDRLDLQLEVPRLPLAELAATGLPAETSAIVAARVAAARQRQLARAGRTNAQLQAHDVSRDCALDSRDRALLERAADALSLSARAYHRLLRVARTIADLAGAEQIVTAHLTEAIQYRRLDRRG
jgi:magnesium chelatase family protein